VGVQSLGNALGPKPALGVVGKPPEREQGEVALRDDIGVVTRAPELGEAPDPPTSTTRPRLSARATRAARLAACCPAGLPTPPAAATASPSAFARRAHRLVVGTPGSAVA
jgi:hypothetical protein